MIEEYNLVWFLTFSNNHIRRNIDDWNVKEAIKLIENISLYYGLRFERRLKTITNENGEYKVVIDILDRSGIYYINCYVETIEDLKVKPKVDENLIAQLENLGLNKIVHNVRSEELIFTYPLYEDDYVIDNEGNIIDCGNAV